MHQTLLLKLLSFLAPLAGPAVDSFERRYVEFVPSIISLADDTLGGTGVEHSWMTWL